MEIYVLSDRQLASIADWQRAIEAEGFGLRLPTETQFEVVRGFLPAQLGEKKTGFECYQEDARELMDVTGEIDFGHTWNCALGFRWGTDFTECLAAWMGAMAYARAVDGVVFDPQEGKVLTPLQALEITRGIERDLPTVEQAMRDAIKKLAPR